jgi:hypothetical protein
MSAGFSNVVLITSVLLIPALFTSALFVLALLLDTWVPSLVATEGEGVLLGLSCTSSSELRLVLVVGALTTVVGLSTTDTFNTFTELAKTFRLEEVPESFLSWALKL